MAIKRDRYLQKLAARRRAWREHCTYGGLPFVLSLIDHEEKSKCLKDLFAKTCLADVLEHNNISDALAMEDLLNILSSPIGSLATPTRLANTFKSEMRLQVSPNTLSRCLDCLVDAFILRKAHRCRLKVRRHIGIPLNSELRDENLELRRIE